MFLPLIAILSAMFANVPSTPVDPSHTVPIQTTVTNSCPKITVQSGDTLNSLATTYNLTWPRLAALNNLTDPNVIYPTQVLDSCGALSDNDVQIYLKRVQPAPVQPAPVTPVNQVPQPQPVYQQPAQAQPAPQQPTYQQPVQQSSGSVVDTIRAVFGPNANAAINIARCESGFNPNATNGASGAAGIFQFLPSTWRTTPYASSSPYNADANIRAAYAVFVRDGYSWREWSCRP